MRGAAPIEGQLSFGVLLEEPPVEPDEPAAANEPRSAVGVTAPASTPPTEPGALPGLPDEEPPDDIAIEASPRADPQDWHAILDFERAWTGSASAKQRAVRDRFGIGSARYHQLLDRALERPEALVYDPGLVGRLRRVRDARRRKRFAERLEVDPPAETPDDHHAERASGPSPGQGGGGG